MITKETATSIALAYREIEAAEKLLEQVEEQIKQYGYHKDIRDAFGRRVGGLQLGVPSGESGHRLFDVPWTLAKPVIEAHIAAQKSIVAAYTEKARMEICI